MPKKYSHTDCFNHFGVKWKNIQWSWSGRSEDAVAATLWQDRLLDRAGNVPSRALLVLLEAADQHDAGDHQQHADDPAGRDFRPRDAEGAEMVYGQRGEQLSCNADGDQ